MYSLIIFINFFRKLSKLPRPALKYVTVSNRASMLIRQHNGSKSVAKRKASKTVVLKNVATISNGQR